MTRIEGKTASAAVKDILLSNPDGLHEVIRAVMQEVLEAEMDEALGASKGERTPERLGYRSGYYGRTLVTRVGKLELRVPQDRAGRFSTELFERYQRSERALVATLAEMYVQGVSTRKVKAITEELCGHAFSAASISAINKCLDESLRPCCKLFSYGDYGMAFRFFAGGFQMFKGRHFDQSVILLCVRWYLAYSLSLRDLKEMMAERGISIDHSTIHRWVVHFSPLLLQRFNRRKRGVTGKWHADETYIKVRGQWMYLYRAIDSVGDTVEFWFSEHRDQSAAKRFFRKALERHSRPDRVVIDGSQTNREAIVSCDAASRLRDRSRRKLTPIRIRQSQYLNNRIEQDHRRIKRRVRPMLGFKSFAAAAATLDGIEMIHMMRKRQARYAYNPNPSVAEQFEIIAAA